MQNLKLIKPQNIVLVVCGALFSALAVTSFVRVGDLTPQACREFPCFY